MKTLKKLLVIAATVIMFCVISVAASAGTYGDLTYTVSNGEVTITDCSMFAKSVEIPAEIDGYPVISIDYEAFAYCERLTSVTIPDSVTSIGDNAFYYCYKLTSVTIGNSVTSIGDYAFEDCIGLKSVYIKDVAAWCNIDFKNSSSNPKYYAERLYINNKLLTELVIPDSVTSIGDYAFYYCENLTSVTIPDSVTRIGAEAFCGCTGLKNVYITDIDAWCNIDFKDYNSNPMSYAERLYVNNKLLTKLVIPDSVTSIGKYAFYNCKGLTSVTIPDSVTSSGASAFYDCAGLKNVYITDIAAWCNIDFGDEYSNPMYYTKELYVNNELLTELVIPDSVTSIGDYAFNNCKDLTSVTIPDSVTSIGDYAFNNCEVLISVTIGNSVTSIGDYAFNNCKGLTSVTIPDSVTSIGDYAFNNCKVLISVTIGNSVTSIGDCAFNNCDGLTSITIPDSVTSIGGYAFSACEGLTSVTIGNSVTSIGDYAFSACEGLTSVTIPNSVTSIGEYAFYNCKGLTSVTIGNSVTSIGFEAFYKCYGLTKINWDAKNVSDFTAFSHIFGGAGYNENGIEVIFGDNIERIPAHLFDGLWRDGSYYPGANIKSVIICNSVTSIGDSAFPSCPEDVYFTGTEEEWPEIDNYTELAAANIHYNYKPHVHSYKSSVTKPTCTETGYTTYTCDCGDTYTADQVNASGHTKTTVKGYAATCTKTGLTDGEKCSVCGEIFTAQKTIAATGHTKITVKGYAATCTKTGLTDGVKCSVCNETLTAQKEIPATGHTKTTVKGYAATCTKTGLTDGAKCSVCNETLTAQKDIPMLSHTFGEWVVVTAPTASAEGMEERACSGCGEKETRVIEKLSGIIGDVNGDDQITAADARLALRISAGLETLESVNAVLEIVDYNGDKQVTAADARLILRKSAGLA